MEEGPPATTTCAGCGDPNPTERRFCRRCGAALDRRCEACGFVNAADDAFCGGCGLALAAPIEGRTRTDPLGGGDRRWVTAEFVDLVGSAPLTGQLDPEDLRDVLREYHAAVGEVIGALGGTVARVQGDGVFAYFGWPLAHGDDARRAVRAGLDAVERVEALAPAPLAELDAQLTVRVGIHTGLTVVSDMGTADRVEIDDLVGDTPMLAARLQSVAGAGEVLLSGATARQVEGWFELEDRRSIELKGIEGEVVVRRAVAPTTARSRIEARYGSDLPPLVGRQSELEWLERRAAEATTGPVVAVVLGDAGAGKSRLMRAFLDQGDVPTLVLSCRETHRTTALHPLVGLSPAPPGVSEAVAGPGADESRTSWLASLADAVAGSADIVLVEDAHWADPTTLDLVVALSRVQQGLLVLVTARAEEAAAVNALPAAHTWVLAGLEADDVVALVRQVAAGRAVPPDVAAEIVTRAAGNPLFAEELTEAYLDSGEDVPAGLQALLTARLDRLGPARPLVQVAAVIGTRFDAETLDALAPEAVQRGLDRLIEERIIEPRPRADGSLDFEFRHALVHQVAYESVLRSERRVLHGRLADLLLADERPVPPEAVARHLEAAGRPEAWEQWARAARHAMRANHWAEAAGQLEAAIALVAADADAPDAARRELDLRGQHSVASGMTGQLPLAAQRDAATRVLVLARSLGDTQQQVYAGLLLAIAEQSLGEFDRAVRRIGEVAELTETTGDLWIGGVVRVVRDAMAVWLGVDGPAAEDLDATLADVGFALDQPVEPTSLPGPAVNGWIGGLSVSGLVHQLRGDGAAARSRWNACQVLADGANEPGATAMYEVTRSMAAAVTGDIETAATSAQRALAVAEEAQHTQWAAWGLVLKGWTEVQRGAADGLPLLETGLARLDADARHLRPFFGALHAEALLTTDPAAAHQVLDEAMATMETTGERLFEPELHRVRAALAAAEGRPDQAADAAAAATAAAQRQGFTAVLAALTTRESTA